MTVKLSTIAEIMLGIVSCEDQQDLYRVVNLQGRFAAANVGRRSQRPNNFEQVAKVWNLMVESSPANNSG